MKLYGNMVFSPSFQMIGKSYIFCSDIYALHIHHFYFHSVYSNIVQTGFCENETFLQFSTSMYISAAFIYTS